MGFSQIAAWPLSFITPVFTLLLLALPIPAPTLAGGGKFILALTLPLLIGALSLLPFLEQLRSVGILLVFLALFYSFYYTTRGGSPLMGTFMTLGLTLVVTIGSISIEMLFLIAQALLLGATFGPVFVWIAHAFLPDLHVGSATPSKAPEAPQKT
jgi:hypothetical protein